MVRKRKLTGREKSLFDFVQEKEKLFCPFCKDRHEVVQPDGNYSLLGCGHIVIRELSVSLEEEHNWRLKYGWPKIRGGWWRPPNGTYDVYPGPGEMAVRIRMMPGIVGEIRKVMGKDWQPESTRC